MKEEYFVRRKRNNVPLKRNLRRSQMMEIQTSLSKDNLMAAISHYMISMGFLRKDATIEDIESKILNLDLYPITIKYSVEVDSVNTGRSPYQEVIAIKHG
jgi:hypothetical protein